MREEPDDRCKREGQGMFTQLVQYTEDSTCQLCLPTISILCSNSRLMHRERDIILTGADLSLCGDQELPYGCC